jgi:hypothetical protein
MSRAITEDEARANFLEHVLIMVQYWEEFCALEKKRGVR